MSDVDDIVGKLTDQRWRLDNLYYIMDKNGKKIKFKMNQVQEHYYKSLHTNNITLKARQMGFTTFIQLYMLDLCLFRPNLRCGVIAHNRNDAQVFFRDKIKFAYDCLPEWLRAEREAYTDSAGELRLSNNSSIRVGTSLRSGTNQVLHISEFGKICAQYPLKAKEIMTGALNTVQAGQQVHIESTAEGNSGYFYNLCQEAMQHKRRNKNLLITDYKFHFYPWHSDTTYMVDSKDIELTATTTDYFNKLKDDQNITITQDQMAWYQAKAAILHDDIKREYPSTADEAFLETVEGSYWLRWLNDAEVADRIGKVPLDTTYNVNTYWDIGMDDATAIWFVQKVVGGSFLVIDYFEASDRGMDYYADVLKDRGYSYGTHYAPHDIEVREFSSALSRRSIAKTKGIDFKVCKAIPRGEGIDAVRNILNKCYFDESKAEQGLRALRNYRRKWDVARGKWDDQPLHDWSSHAADAFKLFAINSQHQTETKIHKPRDFSNYQPIQQRAAWI